MSTLLLRARLTMAAIVFLLYAWAAMPAHAQAPERLAPWIAHDGRARPLVAVVGENAGTELTDFAIPYGVLARAGVADVVALATRDGPITMRPARLKLAPHATTARFDRDHPGGADYVFVPAVVRQRDPALLAWLAAQQRKGATLVSICDGALVLANAGLLDGRRATAHWATESHREEHYPSVHWVKNARYVVDGAIVSSAGISAAMPTSIAVVEAIAGRERADALAAELGVDDWSTAHDSDAFQPRFGKNLLAYLRTFVTNAKLHRAQQVGVPVADGVDEIALAFTADAWSRTGRSQAYALAGSDAPVTTRGGLVVLPDADATPQRALPALSDTRAARALDAALAAIAQAYGRSTAYGVALNFEYAGFRK